MSTITKILHSTATKVISAILVILLCVSFFVFYDFYKRQYHKALGFYLIYKGDLAFKEQNLQKAIYLYEKGIKLHPKHYKAMYNLANIYVVYEDYYAALANYEKALKIRPDYEVARIDYAIILMEVYNIDEAIEQYNKVIINKPRSLKIPFIMDRKKTHEYNLGVAYYNMGIAYRTKSLLAGLNRNLSKIYLERAKDSYSEAVKILNTYNTNYNLALTNQILKNQNQAAHFYCKAMELSPLDFEAHFNYAIILTEMGDYLAAQEEFERAILIINLKSDVARARYMFNVLADVNQKLTMNKDDRYYEKLRKRDEMMARNQYKAGKLVMQDDDADAHIMREFSQCVGGARFMGDM